MSNGVEFEEDKYGLSTNRPSNFSPVSGGSVSSKMVQWLIDKGIVKSESAAQGLLLGIVILNVIITIVVIKYLL